MVSVETHLLNIPYTTIAAVNHLDSAWHTKQTVSSIAFRFFRW